MTTRFDGATAARLDRTYAAPEIAEQRARTRAALGAGAGERGLDIGCGPGFLACELAGEVGDRGRVVGLDASLDMLAIAHARVAREGLGERVTLLLGDATRLPFAAGSFDFVTAVQVYLHVAEVERALGEAARVIRPGGRLVVVDTDWDSCVWLTGDRARHRRVMEARMADLAEPHLAPRLPGLLRAAGLRVGHAAVIPLLDIGGKPASFSADAIGITGRAAVRQGVPPAEVDLWEADLRGRAQDGGGGYFFSVNRYLFVATRPPLAARGVGPRA